jgi:hypothetical protein
MIKIHFLLIINYKKELLFKKFLISIIIIIIIFNSSSYINKLISLKSIERQLLLKVFEKLKIILIIMD